MGINHRVSFVCDWCESEYLIDEKIMEIPPSWIACHLAVSNEEGYIPEHERENFLHFCCRECLIEYISNDDFLERIFIADQESHPHDQNDMFPFNDEDDDDGEEESV